MPLECSLPVPRLTRSTRARRFALWAALGASAPGLACAGVAGVLTTTVTTLATQVTYATVSKSGAPLVTYIGYEFTTGYAGTNTTNNAQLRGDLAVTDAAELATLTLDTANSPSYCRTQPASNALKLVCDLPQLRSGSAPITFQVFFKAPSKVDGNGVGDAEASDLVTLTGTTVYAEQSDGAGNTNNSAPWVAPQPVLLGTSNPIDIRSVLPRSGGKLFTGNGGIPSAADVFGTDVTVPAYAGYTKATILESEDPLSVCVSAALSTSTRLQPCFNVDLTIVDGNDATAKFASALSIKLSIDGSVIPQKVKPSDLTIKYDGTVIGACPGLGVPLSAEPYQPCINTAVRIKDNKNPDRDGDIVIELLNYRNGSYKIL